MQINHKIAHNQSTTEPISPTACMRARGTSQNTGRKPPQSVSLWRRNLPKFQVSGPGSTNSGYRTPTTVWYVISVTRALLERTKPQQCFPARPAASANVVASRSGRSSPLTAIHRMARAAFSSALEWKG